MVKDSVMILILQLVKNNGSVDRLLNLGLEYSQIARCLSFIKEEGFAEGTESGLVLSEKGKAKLKELNKKFDRSKSAEWISPLDEFKLDKVGIYEIYLPSKSVVKEL
ncbi:hypothetical protein [Brevibacillus brevis]|uniref:hypothetical protein n=1 Tax=Brevibacillus brevis TaxID=1393 RepID=UPI000D113486|nr:hypothetical protein [Brevibacillus brevis]PSJ70231.1 hypothetical protein C7J99_06660 [Brevibacillus brevis]RED30116.1 hypothetical protein DES34_105335 [Brevibacillus brevis]GEC88146.1 hypothetical protein BBR01nite_04770 [Brevibacillus brevis]VEF88663.1 Uncharacterised protein [Brevibacillus brevis]